MHAPELDKVLNVTDGTLNFYTPAEAEDGYYPWAAEEGYAKSTNQGVDSSYVDATYTIPSASVVNTTVETKAGKSSTSVIGLAVNQQIGCTST